MIRALITKEILSWDCKDIEVLASNISKLDRLNGYTNELIDLLCSVKPPSFIATTELSKLFKGTEFEDQINEIYAIDMNYNCYRLCDGAIFNLSDVIP